MQRECDPDDALYRDGDVDVRCCGESSMEKHKAWICVFREHRDAAAVAATGHIPGLRHRV